MNFFEHQESARKKTAWLVLLMCLAVFLLILITIFAVSAFFYFLQSHATSIHAYEAYSTSLSQHFFNMLQSPLGFWVGLVIIAVVMLGSAYKFSQLSGGGVVVAESLNGKLIPGNTNNHQQRILLNVVEEMAIASGNPVPPVYLIDSSGINAFAAGLSRNDAVIGVTQGLVDHLNREQLQGVMAHEFSHIHNGDMRLNLRLVAILHGILVIGIIGSSVMRGSSRSFGYRRRGDNAVFFGLFLAAIGYGGTFFGNIIKAAVSRQREFLADASAVQFTRNPNGIAAALKTIGGCISGSEIFSPAATEFSHLYFAQGITTYWRGLTATHPPLEERIRRIEPRWDGKFITPKKLSGTEPENIVSPNVSDGTMAFAATTTTTTAQTAINQASTISPKSLENARDTLKNIPPAIAELAHEPFGARALIYGLLLDKKQEQRQQQIVALQEVADSHVLALLTHIEQKLIHLPRKLNLSLVDMCMPALKQLSREQYIRFKRALIVLVKSDKHISLYEWCLYRIVTNNLSPPPRTSRTYTLKQLEKDAARLLYFLARVNGDNNKHIVDKALASLTLKSNTTNSTSSQPTYSDLDRTLIRLNRLRPLQKPLLLKAMLEIIQDDGKITATEFELFRAIADSINCPIPPL